MIKRLNRDCQCATLDPLALARALDAEYGQSGIPAHAQEHLIRMFAPQSVFVSASAVMRITEVVKGIETVVALPAYRRAALAEAPDSAKIDPRKAHGVLFGYDFHVNGDNVHLIEINTNAGGAMLNAVLARAQRSCCSDTQSMVPTTEEVTQFERRLLEMFQLEWQLTGATRQLQTIAIVDEMPTAQFLYPEFLLFQQLFERHGIQAVIVEPNQFELGDRHLYVEGQPIDLVYNRLTDFYLQASGNATLLEAWRHHVIVLTPHPQAHALYANKALLAVFSNSKYLRQLGAPSDVCDLLQKCVPATERVTTEAAERLWSRRRELFFKPVSGYGSRATYRGDKLTRGVWQDILNGEYIAQTLVRPGERQVRIGEKPLKYDVRAYVYNGQVQWLAARLYQGQTTNMRTPGGGFSPVFSPVDAQGRPRKPGQTN